MALDGDVKIPGAGELPKKYVIGAVAAGVVIVVVVVIRKKNSAAAAAAAPAVSSAAGMVSDPAGNQCVALDPNSGYCPGSPEDVAFQESASGASYAASGYGGDIGYPGTGASAAGLGLTTDPAGNVCVSVNPATGYCPGSPQDQAAQQSGSATSATGTTTTGGAPTSNSQWMSDALAVLPGGSSSANEAALAGVLGGLTVTTAQKNIFLEAVGLEGQPPQGYPTPIKTSDTAAQPGSPAKTAGAISGLTVLPSGTGMQAKWNAATGATGGYSWQLTGPQNQSGKTTSTVVTVHNLKKGTYNFGIQALPGGKGDNGHVTVG
jgi:hypothetical protein